MFYHEAEVRSVTLVRANSRLSKTTREAAILHFSGEQTDSLGHGAEGAVFRVGVTRANLPPVEMAYKDYSSEGKTADALKAWVFLKRGRVPVPNTFRLVQDEERYAGILMTDLTHGWRDILITSNATKGYVIDNVFQNYPETVRSFAKIRIMGENYDLRMDERLREMAQQATDLGVYFHGLDVPSAIFTHTGELLPVISDMGNVTVGKPVSFEHNFRMLQGIHLFIRNAHEIAYDLVRN